MITVQDLRSVAAFEGLPEEHLAWMAEQCVEQVISVGEMMFIENSPAEEMFILFEGAVQMRRDRDAGLFNAKKGDISGLLPYSRLKIFNGKGFAVEPTRAARFHKKHFAEMTRRMPVLTERLVGILIDRVRDVARSDEQSEKLVALGKLAAGLAHELNNPAGAAVRAAADLRDMRLKLRTAYLKLDCRNLTPRQRGEIAEFEECALSRVTDPGAAPQSSLDRSDREEELARWMDEKGITDSWEIAPMLMETGITTSDLDEVAGKIGMDAVGDALSRCQLSLTAARLVYEIEQSVTRISELVSAVKEYSYMDQAKEQEIDVHTGIESTLTILGFKLRKRSIDVVKEYDRSLEKICAFGAELNQVWTNIIVNAIEAMPEGGRLLIRTFAEPLCIVVEIIDTGTGIDPDVLPRIFEPFVTTKDVGQGTGLGLDTSMRIVKKHRGEIRVESKPGETKFSIRLPKKGK